MRMQDLSKISFFDFAFGVNQRELGDGVSSRFPCTIQVLESFSSSLLRAIISYWTKLHLESCQTSTMELFRENSQQTKDVDYFYKKALL